MNGYGTRFYDRRQARVMRSAEALVPILMGLLAPRSVIDIGCGNGIWVEAFRNHGADQAVGIDGPWVPRDRLRVPADGFIPCDLGKAALPYAIDLPRPRFDMVLCLELLEHIEGERADAMLDLLCSLSDTLIVSAAVPHQGGTGHVNEQWPDYWGSRFAARGYVACDFLRLATWSDDRIAPWYRQNVIGYFRGGPPKNVTAFARQAIERTIAEPIALCHPGVFSYKLGKLRSWLHSPVRTGVSELRRRFSA